MDWTKIIEELSAAGIRQWDMAAHCGCTQSTISEIKIGDIANPSWPIGQGLLDLHAKHCRRARRSRVAA